MKPREVQRELHPDALYGTVEIPVNGEHHLRIPSPLQGGKLIRLMSEAGGTESDYMIAIGAVIGSSWYHRYLDLETPHKGDLSAYGEAVFEELHAAGYRLEWMLVISRQVVDEIGKLATISDEVKDRLGFSNRKKEESASTTSKSRKRTSARRSPTTS